MTAKEKAKELLDKMSMPENIYQGHELAKQCAIIAVLNIISSNPHNNLFNTNVHSTKKYWEQVKIEIENL